MIIWILWSKDTKTPDLSYNVQQLSDKDYLKRYIEHANMFYANGIYMIKDENSQRLSPSLIHMKMLGFSKPDEIIGLKDEQIPCKATAELAETFYSQDREVRNTRRDLYLLDLLEYSAGLAICKLLRNQLLTLIPTMY